MSGDPVGRGLTDRRLYQIAGCLCAFILVLLAFALWWQADHKTADQKGWWAWTTSDKSSGFYTFGLIGVGAVQAALFVWQLVLIRNSLADTKDAAGAAKEQAKLARESLIASNRAWLTLELKLTGGFVSNPEQVGTTASFALRNIGNSVALDAVVEVWCLGCCAGTPDAHEQMLAVHRENVAKTRGAYRTGPFTLFPGQGYPDESMFGDFIDCPCAAEERQRWSGSRGQAAPFKVSLLLGGRVTYKATADEYRTTSVLYEVVYNRGGFVTPETGRVPEHDVELSRSGTCDGCWAT